MLTITIPSTRFWSETQEQFFETKEQTLKLEHSLVSVSKWEEKWHKPYLSKDKRTDEEVIDYIRCMTITQNVDPLVYYGLTQELIDKISKYINDPHTATTFKEPEGVGGGRNKEVITAEKIYYQMLSNGIPYEFEKWHLNKLLTLIKVFNIMNSPPKKMSKGEILRSNAALNAQRLKKYNTTG